MIATGAEDEFRGLFAEEADTQLTRISEQVLELESGAEDAERLATLFRDAHTLKGAAAVVGCDEVSTVAHALEDLFETVRGGHRAWDSRMVDGVLATVDVLRAMVDGLMSGERRVDLVAVGLEALAQVPADAPAADSPAEPEAVEELPAEVPDAPDTDEAPIAEQTPEPATPRAVASGEPVAAESPAEPRTVRRPAVDADIVRVPRERLDEIIRLAGQSAAAHLRVGEVIRQQLGVEPASLGEYRELSGVLSDLSARAMRSRMVTLETLAAPLRRAVRDVARATGKQVRFELHGEHVELDRHVLEELRDPLLHLLRNAVDHGLEDPEARAAAGKEPEGLIRLGAHRAGSQLVITVRDDGRGANLERLRSLGHASMSDDEALQLMFRPGASTAAAITDISGRGVGLDVVAERLGSLRGQIDVRNFPGEGLEFSLHVPVTLSILGCLMVEAAGGRFAIPLDEIASVLGDPPENEFTVEGHPAVWADSEPVEVKPLADLLGMAGAPCAGPVVVLQNDTRRFAVRVDRLLGQRDAVIKELGQIVPPLVALAGASVEPDGSIMLVLSATGLIELGRSRRGDAPLHRSSARVVPTSRGASAVTPASLLVVDDAMTVRELQRSILARAGYTVRTAANGREAMGLLGEEPADLVLTDYEMPEMDGFALCRAIRAHQRYSSLPIILLTSRDSPESRRAGLEAGADAYLIKSEFNEAGLLAAVDRLLAPQLEDAA